jgi:hypothetical protein
MLGMSDKPAPTPPRQPLQLPPNCRDVMAERIGVITTEIVGATVARLHLFRHGDQFL